MKQTLRIYIDSSDQARFNDGNFILNILNILDEMETAAKENKLHDFFIETDFVDDCAVFFDYTTPRRMILFNFKNMTFCATMKNMTIVAELQDDELIQQLHSFYKIYSA